jgi:hypothetical protein
MIIKKVLQNVLVRLGFDFIRTSNGVAVFEFPPDWTTTERQTYAAVRPYTMTSPERVLALIRATEYLVQQDIDGALVECGVWRGGSAMAMALTLKRLGATSRDLYLYDTFEGMTPPTEEDVGIKDGVPALELYKSQQAQYGGWCQAGLEDVRKNLLSTGYPSNRIHFIEGRVESTLPAQAPASVALLRLDTDWYESTRHELQHLFPRLVGRGVLVLDDYGCWRGAKKAVDEYLANNRICILLQRIDAEGRIAVK